MDTIKEHEILGLSFWINLWISDSLIVERDKVVLLKDLSDMDILLPFVCALTESDDILSKISHPKPKFTFHSIENIEFVLNYFRDEYFLNYHIEPYEFYNGSEKPMKSFCWDLIRTFKIPSLKKSLFLEDGIWDWFENVIGDITRKFDLSNLEEILISVLSTQGSLSFHEKTSVYTYIEELYGFPVLFDERIDSSLQLENILLYCALFIHYFDKNFRVNDDLVEIPEERNSDEIISELQSENRRLRAIINSMNQRNKPEMKNKEVETLKKMVSLQEQSITVLYSKIEELLYQNVSNELAKEKYERKYYRLLEERQTTN
eukprot:TRINITY_DN6636_c0_g1_i1.p1 TRINITY_DN6636_c0_g1~~TRINITY_DN6636_c0_g1_i1.p1  ORF type:complete len:318 (-),score=78.11 TRINITY_DN6636_c0_g1_i1:5-958(-)